MQTVQKTGVKTWKILVLGALAIALGVALYIFTPVGTLLWPIYRPFVSVVFPIVAPILDLVVPLFGGLNGVPILGTAASVLGAWVINHFRTQAAAVKAQAQESLSGLQTENYGLSQDLKTAQDTLLQTQGQVTTLKEQMSGYTGQISGLQTELATAKEDLRLQTQRAAEAEALAAQKYFPLVRCQKCGTQYPATLDVCPTCQMPKVVIP